MKLFISADIEGITGISTWEEAANAPNHEAKERMTKEVAAACKGAIEAGVREIVIKDAHGDGKNLLYPLLPRIAKLISGWSNHPYNMVEGLDDTFDGIAFIGYHSHATSNASPLAHTLDPRSIRGIYINDKPASEFLIYAYAATMIGVPIVAVSGDGGLVREVRQWDEKIAAVAVQEGFGGGIVSIHPEVALERIEKAVKTGVEQLASTQLRTMPEVFNLKIVFKRHQDAYKYSFYPGAKQIDEFTISYTSDDYMDILTFLLFI
ncbi:MAG: M55 family metallopeptidase [Cellulosilyticaceae bacterium]